MIITSKTKAEISCQKHFFKESSETIRAACTEKISNVNLLSKNRYKNPNLFSWWLAGLIDADGLLLVSKAGYTSCEITVAEKEWHILALVKSKLGGSIKKRTGVKELRWRLHNTPGMKTLVSLINDKLSLKVRNDQLLKVSQQLEVYKRDTSSLFSNENAWLAGFFEGEGYFHLNKNNFQLSITLSQKDKTLLDKIASLMGGRVFFDKSWDGWLYAASNVDDIALWVNYFSRFPLISYKQIQLRRFIRLLLYKSRKVHLKKEGRDRARFDRLVSGFSD